MTNSKQFLEQFKKGLIDAGNTFNRPPSSVTMEQWRIVAKGKTNLSAVRALGFASLRNAVAPNTKSSKTEQTAIKTLVAKLLK